MLAGLFGRWGRPAEHRPESRECDSANKPRFASKRQALEHGLSFQVGYYKRWAHKNRRLARNYRIATVVLGALVTALLGLEVTRPFLQDLLPQLAFLGSTVLTALASFEAFRDPSGETVRFQDVYLKLLELRARYNFEIAEPTSAAADEVIERYWEELQGILSGAHAQRVEALETMMSQGP